MIEPRKRRRRDGREYTVYRVRFYGTDGRERSRTFDSRADARAFEAKVRLLKRGGDLEQLDRGRETLAAFAEHWWEVYAEPNLEPSTLRRYASVWNVHALPRLGGYQLRELNPEIVARFRAELERDGVGAPTVRKVLTMVQGMLARAVEWGRIPSNPVQAVKKPKVTREEVVHPLAPVAVERLRRHMLEQGRHRDATIVSVLAYAGPRPYSEALALRWEDVRDRTLRVYGRKRRRNRTVDLLAPLHQDLAEWRLASGRPDARQLVFPTDDGDEWKDHDCRNWRKRVFKPAAAAVGLEADAHPYELRHSFVSLLLHEGRLSVVEIAEQLGHSPVMTLGTYAHVVAELKGAPKVSADEQIRQARLAVFASDAAQTRPTGQRASGQ